ncbi:hypothetical protein BDZ97DRAFT_1790907 [Flammula alnicola]|nr:hypothetical protein BDZ97DRAFT_1790907 [Flammula alnicola]
MDVDLKLAPHSTEGFKAAVAKELLDPRERIHYNRTNTLTSTQFKFHKTFPEIEGKPAVKGSVKEHRALLLPDAITTDPESGVQVASIPTLIVLKICAIDRRRTRVTRQKDDCEELALLLGALKAQHGVVPKDVQALIDEEQPRFSWAGFWSEADKDEYAGNKLRRLLHSVGFEGVSRTKEYY